jgi:hypothetical protein
MGGSGAACETGGGDGAACETGGGNGATCASGGSTVITSSAATSGASPGSERRSPSPRTWGGVAIDVGPLASSSNRTSMSSPLGGADTLGVESAAST